MNRLLKSKIPLFLCLTGISLSAWAEEQVSTLDVWAKSGEKFTYYLSEHPVAAYSGSDLVLKTDELTVNYPLSELHKFTFDSEAASVETISLPDGRMQMQKGMLCLSGFRAGERVSIYSMEGQNVMNETVSADGTATLFIQSLATGVYVVKAGSVTHKIIKQ